jgi:hypothetical protein
VRGPGIVDPNAGYFNITDTRLTVEQTPTDIQVSPPRLGSSAGSSGMGPFSDLGAWTDTVPCSWRDAAGANALTALLLARDVPRMVREILAMVGGIGGW